MIMTEMQNIWPLILPDKFNGISYKPNPSELINLIREGVPGSSLNNTAMVLGITQAQICKLLHMSPRTAQRGASCKLDVDKSDHLIQIAKAFQRCVDMFGGKEKAIRWVKSPNHSLGGQHPLDLMDTKEGIELIQDALIRLEYGVYA